MNTGVAPRDPGSHMESWGSWRLGVLIAWALHGLAYQSSQGPANVISWSSSAQASCDLGVVTLTPVGWCQAAVRGIQMTATQARGVVVTLTLLTGPRSICSLDPHSCQKGPQATSIPGSLKEWVDFGLGYLGKRLEMDGDSGCPLA